jgi:replicative DNA helicase
MTEAIYNKDAEMALLGAVLIFPECISEVRRLIRDPRDFYVARNRFVWESMVSLHDKGSAIDNITVTNEMDVRGTIEEVGPAYITELLGAPMSSLNATTYAHIIHNCAIRRRILGVANQLATLAYREDEDDIPGMIAEMQEQVKSVADSYTGLVHEKTISAEQLVSMSVKSAMDAAEGIRIYPTGIAKLDDILTPQNGELITVAARPGGGKSSALNTFALHNARNGKSVKIFQLEAGAIQLGQRLISQLSGVPAYDIFRGKLNDETYGRYMESARELGAMPIKVCDATPLTISQIKTESRREQVDAIIVDYVQLVHADKTAERRDIEIGEVTMGLKELAMEMNIPVFMAAQLSRASEQRADHRPILSDLRESGSIEANSDSVLFIHRPDESGTAELIVAKHRQGPTGLITAFFDEKTMRFCDAKVTIVDEKYLRRTQDEPHEWQDYTDK